MLKNEQAALIVDMFDLRNEVDEGFLDMEVKFACLALIEMADRNE